MDEAEDVEVDNGGGDVLNQMRWKGWQMMRVGLDPISPKWEAYEPSSFGPPPGLPDGVVCWQRRDYDCFTFRGTTENGPDWHDVVWRRSINEETNQIFDEGSVLGSDFNIHGHFDPMVLKLRAW